ncbi:MAG: ribulose 1,5-bisphosphate carboxylase large subunit [Balneolia bacterium]|nr:ribulose 1,5-bisphosphate carboxylase large subunit [Balneolia bacterium]
MPSPRFNISYRITASTPEEARSLCTKVAYEQSVELPDDVLTPEIRSEMVGQVTALDQLDDSTFEAAISYSHASLDESISQLLNVILGNASLFRGVRITGLEWDKLPGHLCPGPKFGIDGVRAHHGITTKRALSCSALKPIGLDSASLADFCYQFALGGIDIIKDDHGMANQSAAPFDQRLNACVDATKRAADKTGHRAGYYPNITADAAETMRRYEAAYEAGAGGVLLIPHLCGLGTLAEIASSDIPLPVMAHPAFSGSYVLSQTEGLTPDFLYGQLWKELGADFSIYPNAGGRFSFSVDECLAINASCRKPASRNAKGCFPTPGGGVQRQTLPELLKRYGNDTVFLIGGSLYQHPKGIEYASRELMEILISDY